jgi:hypothetical protein
LHGRILPERLIPELLEGECSALALVREGELALFDEFCTVATATIDGVAGSGSGHFGAHKRPDHRALPLMHQNPALPAE